MIDTKTSLVLLFDSTSEALLAEKLFKKADIPYKIIPVPRHISSDCGVCIQFFATDKGSVREALDGKVDIRDIRPID
ncbi:MAG: DUF3343 domain-containing protein [Thermodesulfobacteriota bacterium]|nr:DUF3343 domain-containing protein [Thermodesulfobacteriota bacterium]